MASLLDFESGLRPLQNELDTLRKRRNGGPPSEQEVQVENAMQGQLQALYSDLTPWQKVQVARHRERPYSLDYIDRGFTDFAELHGDRSFADDRSIVAGPALLNGRPVMVIGHQKGRDTADNIFRNFGMPHPEGYRKAERLMRQAERWRMPVVTLVDTPGANAGLPDEERGQSEAIASSIATMLDLLVPTVSVVIGEGGSGGALAIAVADRILMLEHSIFTVAAPEASAAILWRDAGKAPDAAAAMKITARDLREFGLVDRILPEPPGGAHRDPDAAVRTVIDAVAATLSDLEKQTPEERREQRYRKYRDIEYYQS